MDAKNKPDRFRLRGELGSCAQYGSPERVSRLNDRLRQPSSEMQEHLKLHATLSRIRKAGSREP